MGLGSDEKVRAIRVLVEALFTHVLYDEELIFVGDEGTILDVSLPAPEELQRRCAAYYKTDVFEEDLRRPLWQLLPELERRRNTAI